MPRWMRDNRIIGSLFAALIIVNAYAITWRWY